MLSAHVMGTDAIASYSRSLHKRRPRAVVPREDVCNADLREFTSNDLKQLTPLEATGLDCIPINFSKYQSSPGALQMIRIANSDGSCSSPYKFRNSSRSRLLSVDVRDKKSSRQPC